MRAALSPRRQEFDPRREFDSVVRERFGALDAAVVDGFFANFGYTMALSLVERLVKLVRARKPALAVEVGSGISTLALNGALLEHGGYLVSVETDVSFAAETARALPSAARVALVCSAEPAELATLVGGWRPGLVVVDGPASGDRFSPPRLELYRSLLSPECVCAVDDTDREENDAAAALLADEHGLRKHDFDDPIYTSHRYSLLLPKGVS